MTREEFPPYTQLEATPGILRSLLIITTDEEACWKPSPARWNVIEVLGHLCHVEEWGFRGRAERIVREDNPHLAGYDPDAWAAAGAYNRMNLEDSLAEFQRQRAQSLRTLEAINTAAFARTAVHGELGPITLSHLLHEWPLHDLGHVRQIAELIRAAKYHPHMGPWQGAYKLAP